jgi:hypothetical protein
MSSYFLFSLSMAVFSLHSLNLSKNPGVGDFINKVATKMSPKPNTGRQIIDHDSVIEVRIFRKLDMLPEVKRKNRYLFSLPNNKKGILMWVTRHPTKSRNYYEVTVGHDAIWHYETFYTFIVWVKPFVIKYLDPVSGKALTLSQWRRRRIK